MAGHRLVRTGLILMLASFGVGAKCDFTGIVNAICANDPSDPHCPPPPPLTVFVTSTAHLPSLGSLGAYDAICNDLASGAGLSGSYVAWLSTSTVDARDRLTEPGPPGFVRVDGAVVATSIADLTDGTIQNPIQLDENGSNVGGALVHTATYPDGTHNDSCANLTGATFGISQGSTSSTDGGWTWSGTTTNCGSQRRFYCFEI